MHLLALVLVAAACPSREAVTELLERSVRAPVRAQHRWEIVVSGAVLRVRLETTEGVLIQQREIAAPRGCGERARVASAVLATWMMEQARTIDAGVDPDQREAAGSSSPRVDSVARGATAAPAGVAGATRVEAVAPFPRESTSQPSSLTSGDVPEQRAATGATRVDSSASPLARGIVASQPTAQSNSRVDVPADRRGGVAPASDSRVVAPVDQRAGVAPASDSSVDAPADQRGVVAPASSRVDALAVQRGGIASQSTDQSNSRVDLTADQRGGVAAASDSRVGAATDQRGGVAPASGSRVVVATDQRGAIAAQSNSRIDVSADQRGGVATASDSRVDATAVPRGGVAPASGSRVVVATDQRGGVAPVSGSRVVVATDQRGGAAPASDSRADAPTDQRGSLAAQPTAPSNSRVDQRGDVASQSTAPSNSRLDQRDGIASQSTVAPSDVTPTLARPNQFTKDSTRPGTVDASLLPRDDSRSLTWSLSADARAQWSNTFAPALGVRLDLGSLLGAFAELNGALPRAQSLGEGTITWNRFALALGARYRPNWERFVLEPALSLELAALWARASGYVVRNDSTVTFDVAACAHVRAGIRFGSLVLFTGARACAWPIATRTNVIGVDGAVTLPVFDLSAVLGASFELKGPGASRLSSP